MSNSALSGNIPGIVVPGTSAGLVSQNGLTGNTTGNNIATGYVGELIIASFSGIAAGSMPAVGTVVNLASLTPGTGIWMVFGKVTFNITSTTATTDAFFAAGLNIVSATETGNSLQLAQFATGQTTYRTCATTTVITLNPSSPTIYLTTRHGATTLGGATFSGTGVGVTSSYLYAVRIA